MAERERAQHEVGFESHGVRVVMEASDAELLARLTSWVPPGAVEASVGPGDARFAILADDVCGYRLKIADQVDVPCRDLELAIGTLQRRIGGYVAAAAQDRISIHAGAVVHQGRAILVPGYSRSGKTTLVTELVDLGATFFSDEYAFLDPDGLVHPYAQPISVRDGDNKRILPPSGDLSPKGTEAAVPVGLVAITAYRAGCSWEPNRLSAGAGAVSLLAHAIAIEDRPADALTAARRACESALILEGSRGEAAEMAPGLLEFALANVRAG